MAADGRAMWGLNERKEIITWAVFTNCSVNVSCYSSQGRTHQACSGWNDLQGKDDPEILDVFGDSSLDIFLTKWWEIIQNPLRAPNHTRK